MMVPSIGDYRALAKRRLPPFLFEYLDGAAYDEVTFRRNRDDLLAMGLRQRVLRNVANIDLNVSILGLDYALPIGLGPIGLAGLMARRGEIQAARAAASANVPFCLSTVSTCPIDELAARATDPFWFQLYVCRDRGFMRDLLAKAKEAGCTALVFTVDMPMPGTRYRDYRSGLAGSPGIGGAWRRTWQACRHPRWAWDVGVRGRPHHLGNVAPLLGENTGIEDFLAWMRTNFDPSVTWRDFEAIRTEWDGPLIIKGVLDPADACDAVRVGADGIVVSNHGGRQLDGTPSTISALRPIAEAVGDRLEIIADGGVRSGLDVVRFLAMGASFVLLGRAWAYALGARGEAGVRHAIDLIGAEMAVGMALTGTRSVSEIGSHILSLPAMASLSQQ